MTTNDDEIPTMETVETQTLIALTPSDLAPVQTELRAWCDRTIGIIQAERTELETNLEIADRTGLKLAGITAAINRTAKRLVYYEKLKAAVDAGYLLVPNFPVEVFAVRVRRRKQPKRTADYESSVSGATPQILAAGEGRYVNDRLFTTAESYQGTNYNKEAITKTRYHSAEYDDVDFPVSVVKPTILEATQRAMALKLFDQMGIVRDGDRDPMIVGQLLDPRGGNRRVTFFVAWWLDLATL